MPQVTQLLDAMGSDGPQTAEQLLPLVYEELRRLAAFRMAQENPGQTLQPTALVHEAWLRLSGEPHVWANRKQFFAAAAEAMRRILIERARRRGRVRHGGGLERSPIEALDLAETTDDDTLLMVHESLERLASTDPTGAELIKLRFFAGLSNVEAARVLELSERTAKRTWAYARAWLYADIQRHQ
jgi:RNA polymerase sigma factor (TIGR02999 family)